MTENDTHFFFLPLKLIAVLFLLILIPFPTVTVNLHLTDKLSIKEVKFLWRMTLSNSFSIISESMTLAVVYPEAFVYDNVTPRCL